MKIRFEKPPAAPNVHNDLSVRYAASKRKYPRLRWYLLVASILSVPGFFIARIFFGFLVVDAPAFVMMPQAIITSPVNGYVQSIATLGEKVTAGETLAVISPFSNETTHQVEAAPSKPNLRSAKKALALADKVLSMRHSQLDEIQKLYDLGAATDADLANAKSLWFTALSQADLAKQTIESQLQTQANMQAKVQQPVPAPIMLRSPFPGIVSYQEKMPGLWVSTGGGLLTVNAERKIWIRAYLNPKDAQYAKIGAPAILIFDDKSQFDAKITSIEPEAIKVPRNFASPLSISNEAIILKLEPLKYLPQKYRIFNLPLTVRFNRLHWLGSKTMSVLRMKSMTG